MCIGAIAKRIIRYNRTVGNLLDILGGFALANPAWIKSIISAGILIQGELTTLLATHLIVESYLSWPRFLFSAMPALVIGETTLYAFGRTMRHTRFGWRMERRLKSNRRVQLYTRFLHSNAGRLFMVAKFIIGANFLVLFLAGWTEVRFGTFAKAYLKSAAVWFSTTVAASYGIVKGMHYLQFKHTELFILGVIILFFVGEYIIKLFMRKAAELESAAEKIGDTIEKTAEEGR